MSSKQSYFAFGSNMLQKRMLERVPSAVVLGSARLRGYELRFHKRGQDGSGKCDAFKSDDPNAVLHGVLYQLCATDIPRLDRVEGLGYGYRRETGGLDLGTGWCRDAFFYVATAIDPTLQPWHWYKELVVCGAIEQALPAAWIRRLRSVPSRADPDCARELRHRRLLTASKH